MQQFQSYCAICQRSPQRAKNMFVTTLEYFFNLGKYSNCFFKYTCMYENSSIAFMEITQNT